MSIGKRVSDAIDKMEASDPEGALFAICAALEATAVKEFGRKGRSGYKDFISQNLELITDIAMGGLRIQNLRLEFDHPEMKKTADWGVPHRGDLLPRSPLRAVSRSGVTQQLEVHERIPDSLRQRSLGAARVSGVWTHRCGRRRPSQRGRNG